jgi:uncharacterized peroxidase-related enzyme
VSGTVSAFTATVPVWRPYVTPVDLDTATDEQRDAMQITPSHKKISAYVLTLAHDPESLKVRSPLFNAIMHGKVGLPLAERELGAIAASVVNRCIYCAAVHASRHIQLTGSPHVVEEIFRAETHASLDPRAQAIFDLGVKLSRTPAAMDADDVARLTAVGLDQGEILDLVLAVAIFGWANRLMHGLGEPVPA